MFRIPAATGTLALLLLTASAQDTGDPPASDSHPKVTETRFEFADVRPSPHMADPWLDGPHLEGDRYVVYEATMADLIANAYNLDVDNVQGGPSWLEFNRYDIQAKTAPTTSSADQKLMLQALLAERFKLVVHNGTAPMPAYVLKVGKDAPKLKSAASTDHSSCDPIPRAPDGPPQIGFSCHNQTMEQLARLLRNLRGGGYLDKPVVDGTGLRDAFDFELTWTPSGAGDRAGAAAVTLFDALEAQLGLKLTLQTAPRPVLMVDRVAETPSPDPPGAEKALPPLPLPEFEVSLVTPHKPDAPQHGSFGRGRLDVQGLTLRDLITVAWDLNDNNKDVIANEPAWLSKDRWDIEAKWSNNDDETASRPPNSDYRQFQQMMRALLAERFGFHAHMEDRLGKAYSLVSISPRLTPADPKTRTRCTEGPGSDGKDPRIANPILNRLMTCHNMTMAQFGGQLQSLAGGYIYDTVLDKTGLKGGYDFTLSFSSVNNILGSGPPPPGGSAAQPNAMDSTPADPNGAVSLFDAVRRELGLKLEKESRPVPVLVIDRIQETPTPN